MKIVLYKIIEICFQAIFENLQPTAGVILFEFWHYEKYQLLTWFLVRMTTVWIQKKIIKLWTDSKFFFKIFFFLFCLLFCLFMKLKKGRKENRYLFSKNIIFEFIFCKFLVGLGKYHLKSWTAHVHLRVFKNFFEKLNLVALEISGRRDSDQ